ncbi:glycosyltransferase [Candidatus Omnitrophota bacterium]
MIARAIEKPYISIIIPTHNSASTLEHTIAACLTQDYPRDRFEILVVDDGSKDNTKKIVENFPVTYIYQKKTGPASARNNGWKNSKGDGLCFIDADCVPYSDWVSKLVEGYHEDDVGAVTGSYAVDGLQYLLDKFVHCEIKYRHSMRLEYVNSFGTYNVLVKRSVFENLKGFDPLYFNASGEDSDLSYRIIKSGYKIYFAKGALVSHRNILRFWRYILVQFNHGYWRMRLYRKNISMITKDEYGYWKDFAELSLIIALIVSIVIDFQNKSLLIGLLIAPLFAIQLLFPVKLSLEEKDARHLVFSFVTFIRGFARVLGGIVGFVVFWIIRK